MVCFDSPGRVRRRHVFTSALDVLLAPLGLQEGKAWAPHSSGDGNARSWIEEEGCARSAQEGSIFDGRA